MTGPQDGPHLILGAGLAGLAFAAALLDEGVEAPIVLLDRRREWTQDRTWCCWDVGVPHAGLASHRWTEWEVVDASGRAVQSSPRHPYLRLPADALYARLLDRIGGAPNVVLRVGVGVRSVQEEDGEVQVETSEGETLRGGAAYDARGPAAPPPGALAQRFLGREVRSERPRFTPGRATLMDFRVPQDLGLHFVYVLPFSAHEALVEDTWITPAPVSPARHREEIDAWLGGEDVEVVREERGILPMTAEPRALRTSPRVHALGAAAGAIRPSSGYAFVRTFAHARALARALARGAPPPERIGRPRWTWLDAVFLRALEADPAAFPARFRRLAERTSGDAFARFMTDASSPRDELAVIAALPKVPFARAALAR